MSKRNSDNPWLALPSSPPYVLADDALPLQQFNRDAPDAQRFELSLFPEPFFGSASAPVVLLALNPGVNPDDYATHNEPTRGHVTSTLQAWWPRAAHLDR